MKKIVIFVITLLLMFSVSIPAFADLGASDFDNWYVICGPEGFNFVDTPDIGSTATDLNDYLEPGTRLWVHSFNNTTNKYLLIVRDENHRTKGKGFLDVTESELDRYFISENETVNKEIGSELNEEVQCVVTSDVGIHLRQGPATAFKSYRVIPYKANISYKYTYRYGGYNWGYTTYKGQSGWTCIDYTEAYVPTTQATTNSTTKPTEKATTEAATQADTTQPDTTAEDMQTTETPAFFSNTGTVIVISCLLAVILALTAVLILLIIKRKN